MKKQFKPKKSELIFLFIGYMFLLIFLFTLILFIPAFFFMLYFENYSLAVWVICISVLSGIATAAYYVFYRKNITIEINDYEIVFLRGDEKFKTFSYSEHTFNTVWVKPTAKGAIATIFFLILTNIPVIGWLIPYKEAEKYIEVVSKKVYFKYDCLRFSDKDFQEIVDLIQERTSVPTEIKRRNEIVVECYDEDLSFMGYDVIKVIYTDDKEERALILKKSNEDYYKVRFEKIYICEDYTGSVYGYWSDDNFTVSIFNTEERAMNEILSTPPFKYITQERTN